MRTMLDSTNAENIPPDCRFMAGYVGGEWPSYDAMVERFPGALVVGIAVQADENRGTVLDVEQFDATPAQAPDWCVMRREAGIIPSVYMNESTWPEVRAAFRDRNVAEPPYWVAAMPGPGPVLYPGSVAHQYADPGPYDLSVVADHWPGVDKEGSKPVGFLAKDPNSAAVVVLNIDENTGSLVGDLPTLEANQFLRAAAGMDATIHTVNKLQFRGVQWIGTKPPDW